MPRIKVRANTFSEQETRIQQALQKRAAEGTPYQELELEFGVAASTLSDRRKGTQNRQKAASKDAETIHPDQAKHWQERSSTEA
jgi:hypothetical protein